MALSEARDGADPSGVDRRRSVRDALRELISRARTWIDACRSESRLLVQAVLYLALDAVAAWPRDDDLWVFGARGGAAFADNSKYLFAHVCAAEPDVRAVWLTKDPAVARRLQAAGYEAYHAHSLRGTWVNGRAGVVVLSQRLRDVNMPASAGATVVQLWHGAPLKTVGWDAELPSLPAPVRIAHAALADAIDLLVVPGEPFQRPLASGLRLPQNRMVTAGYPRHDGLLGRLDDPDPPGDETRAVVATMADREFVFCYLPTFRHGDGEPLDANLDLAALDETLARVDAHLVVKAHPYDSIAVPEDLDHVTGVPADVDVQPLLRASDALITDYSSVAFDYLLLDRPVVFYAYDRDAYRADRGFYFEYDAVTPGPVATDQTALHDAVVETRRADAFAAERRALRARLFGDTAGLQSARVFESIRERL